MKLPPEVIEIYRIVSDLERKYPGRRFTPDGHMVGSIGEVIAAEAFGLRLFRGSFPGHDAIDPEGRNVQIKLTGGSIAALQATCDRLLVMRIMSDRMHAEVIYNGDGAPVWQAAGPMRKNGQRSISVKKLRKMSETNPAIDV